ncbi:MAG: WD40 repeat domain-containing protein [Candidatus Zhuqueibacterota bacterium]
MMKKQRLKSPEEPEIYAIQKTKDDKSLSRRNFLGLGSAITSGIALGSTLSGCEDPTSSKETEAQRKKVIQFAHSSSISSVAFSPDATMLASGSDDRKVKLWRVSDGSLVRTIDASPYYAVKKVAYSRDGTMLASRATDSIITIWNLPDGVMRSRFIGNDFAISPDSSMLATAGHMLTVNLWSLRDNTEINSLVGHLVYINAVAISPDGATIASGSSDQTIKLWGLPNGNLKKTINLTYSAALLAFSPDGMFLVSSGFIGDLIDVWLLPEGILYKSFHTNSPFIQTFDINKYSNAMVISGGDSSFQIRSFPACSLLNTLQAHSGWVTSVVFSPDNSMFASAGDDRHIYLWDLSGKFIKSLHDPALTEEVYDETYPGGFACTCDTICSCNTVCTCDTVSTSSCSSCGYWYPN